MREYIRIDSVLKRLPKGVITREKAINLTQSILKIKTVTIFNRSVKYFNAFYRWVIANNAQVKINPFDGLKVIEKKHLLPANVIPLTNIHFPKNLM